LPGNAPNGQIYYTLNSAPPTINSLLYSTAFKLTNTTFVQAITAVPGYGASPVATAIFVAAGPNNTLAGFSGNGSGWTLNGGATVTNNLLMLTDGGTNEARSAFFNAPQPVNGFQAQFIYQAAAMGATSLGDGATFVVQNAAAGPSALGTGGGGLGYNGIKSSAAIVFFIESGMGTRLSTGGIAGSYFSTLPVNLASGDPIWVQLNYDGSSLVENLADLMTGASYSTNYTVNIPLAVGGSNTAFVGFTGTDGAATSLQTISDFAFGANGAKPAVLQKIVQNPQSVFLPPPTLTAVAEGNQLSVSWPASTLTYRLEFTTNLSTPTSWKAAPQTPIVSNGQATVTVPIGATSTFLRLTSP
jgi:hypothetical protein